jgi:hypothetical protein
LPRCLLPEFILGASPVAEPSRHWRSKVDRRHSVNDLIGEHRAKRR